MTLIERLRTCPNINDARLCIGGVPELIVPVALVEEIEAALETQAAELIALEHDNARLRSCANDLAEENVRLRGLLGEAEGALGVCGAPYFWQDDGFWPDASTPAHREQELGRRQRLARTTLAKLRAETGGGEDGN